MHFTCKTCGEDHEGLPDLAFDAPYYFYTVPEAERDDRCTLGSDLCSIDERDFFIRACLEIPLIDGEGCFAWGVWMSVSERNFRRYQEVFDEPVQSHVGPFPGWLSSLVPGYPDTLRLKARAHLRDHGERPLLELEPTDHPLAVAQREGITLAELQEIYEAHLHPAGPGTAPGGREH
jgi:hypothetical protein